MRNSQIKNILALILSLILLGCDQEKKAKDSEAVTESRESHERDYTGGEGEEDGTMLGITDGYNIDKRGVNLVLSYDADQNTFVGSIKNISDEIIKNVRVEIHLSNGKELGPTTPLNMSPNESKKIKLDASGEQFEKWSAHAEVGSGEHQGESEEGHNEKEGEHDREGAEHS